MKIKHIVTIIQKGIPSRRRVFNNRLSKTRYIKHLKKQFKNVQIAKDSLVIENKNHCKTFTMIYVE